MLPRPDLVVADHCFAGTAAGVGLEVVAFADLDAIALAVASWRGMAVRVVPLDEHDAPQAYAPSWNCWRSGLAPVPTVSRSSILGSSPAPSGP